MDNFCLQVGKLFCIKFSLGGGKNVVYVKLLHTKALKRFYTKCVKLHILFKVPFKSPLHIKFKHQNHWKCEHILLFKALLRNRINLLAYCPASPELCYFYITVISMASFITPIPWEHFAMQFTFSLSTGRYQKEELKHLLSITIYFTLIIIYMYQLLIAIL